MADTRTLKTGWNVCMFNCLPDGPTPIVLYCPIGPILLQSQITHVCISASNLLIKAFKNTP